MQASILAFRALLALYPADFRDEYGREIALAFADRYRHAATSAQRASVWLEAIGGVLREAPREHYRMFVQDLHYAQRTLRQKPGFAGAVVFALALGIGANSAIFSVVNAVMLRTLPVSHPDELYVLADPSLKPGVMRAAWPHFERLRDGGFAGASMAAMSRVARMHARIGGASESETVGVQLVSGEYFGVLGLSSIQGRLLTREDNRTPGNHPVAVISHGHWQRRLGGAPGVVGQDISINGVRFTIVGVAPEGFSGVSLESPTEIWLPLTMQHAVRYSQNYSAFDAETGKPWMPQERIFWLDVLVRAPAGTEATAIAAINTTMHQILSERAGGMANAEERRRFLQKRLTLEPFGHGVSLLRQRFATPLYALMVMAGLVLLIACANTANLLLARAAGRAREIALRLSLGAGRGRLLRQLLTESLLLVAIAGLLALLIGSWTAGLLVRMATATSSGPAPFTPEIDGRVLAFTAVVSLATALLFGVAPAVRATRVDLASTLKAGAHTIPGGSRARMPRLLVALQVALSLVLVVGAGLLVRSLQNVLHIHLGYDRDHVLSVAIDPRLAGYPEEQLPALYDRLLVQINAVPGVRSSAIAMCGILASCRSAETGLSVEGYASRREDPVLVVSNFVSPGYFTTVGMRLQSGRLLEEGDRRGAPGVAVVNQTFVRRYFTGKEPLGRRFGYKVMDQQIVGVVEDARLQSVKDEPEPMAFYPLQQRAVTPRTIEIRTAGDPRQVVDAVRRIILETAPGLPVEGVATLSERVSSNLSRERLLLSLTSAFGALALGLAGFGLFGLLSYAVARSTPDFGIRLALGASQASVLYAVVRDALRLAVAGIVIGLPLAIAGSRLMSALLFGVSSHDGATILTAVVVLVIVAGVAGLLPAWRASRVDPLVALRSE